MNVHAFPSAAKSFGIISLEILKALSRGLIRAIAYASCTVGESGSPITLNQPNPQLDYFRLVSAIDHLTRPVPVTKSVIFDEPYLSRVNRADPTVLARALEDCGYTMADVEVWRTKFADQAPATS